MAILNLVKNLQFVINYPSKELKTAKYIALLNYESKTRHKSLQGSVFG